MPRPGLANVEADGGAMADPDLALVAGAVAGDRAAFSSLVERHYARMHRVAWRLTGSTHDAEDLVQEVCLALAGKLRSFRAESLFSTWLTGVVANACRDHHRKAGRISRLMGRLAVLTAQQEAPDGRDLYKATWLASGLATLPADIRMAVVLVAGEGFSHREAAEALGCAEATVSWRIHEARKRLRRADVDEGGLDGR